MMTCRASPDQLVTSIGARDHTMTTAKYRSYPKQLTMRQVTVDARDKNNRAKQFKVVTTILDVSIDGKQIGDLYERRWNGEVDIRSIKSTMQMDILRCKTPEMVHKEIWTHLLAYNLLRTVMAVAANENDIDPRKISFKGAKQALTAFAPKIEAARPENRAAVDRCDADDHRLSPSRRPSWSLGTAGTQTTTEVVHATQATSTHCQAATQPFKMVLGRKRKVISFIWRLCQFVPSPRCCHRQRHNIFSLCHRI